MNRIHARLLAGAALALFSSSASAQTSVGAPDDTLFRQIAASDSAFFDAYNNCQLSKMKRTSPAMSSSITTRVDCHIYPA